MRDFWSVFIEPMGGWFLTLRRLADSAISKGSCPQEKRCLLLAWVCLLLCLAMTGTAIALFAILGEGALVSIGVLFLGAHVVAGHLLRSGRTQVARHLFHGAFTVSILLL
ncbi:MAG: hypothetical protein H6686_10590 [Fibrobacteria bacterium]|nr:hypothetical protein [Fibrobacteria bacterium]